MKLTVFHPGIEAAGQDKAETATSTGSAARRSSGGPLRLALLDNTKVNSIELMDAIARQLGERIQVEVSRWRKRHAGESGAVVIAQLAGWKPDLVLTGLGD